MQSFFILIIALTVAPISIEGQNVSNSRVGKRVSGEIPLLLIRPVDSANRNHYPVESGKIALMGTSDFTKDGEIFSLEKMLPFFGIDPFKLKPIKTKHIGGNFIPSLPIKPDQHEFLPTKIEGEHITPTGATPFKQNEHFAPLNGEHKFPQLMKDEHLGPQSPGLKGEPLFKPAQTELKFQSNPKEHHHYKLHTTPVIRHEHQSHSAHPSHQSHPQQQHLVAAQPNNKQQLHIQPPHLQQSHAQQSHVQQQMNQQNHAQQQYLQQQLSQQQHHQHQHLQQHAQQSHVHAQHVPQPSNHVQQKFVQPLHNAQSLVQSAHPPKAAHNGKQHQPQQHSAGKIEEHYKLYPGQNNLKHEPHIQIHFEEHPSGMTKQKPTYPADAHYHRYKTYKMEDPHFKINPIPIKPGNNGGPPQAPHPLSDQKQVHQNEIKSEIHYVPPKHGEQNMVVQPVEAFGNKFNYEYKFKSPHKFNEFHRPGDDKGIMYEIRAKPEKPVYHQNGHNQPTVTTNYYYPKVINTDERQASSNNHKGYLPKKNERPQSPPGAANYKPAAPAPHVEYFIPKEQDVTALEVQSQAEVYSESQTKNNQIIANNDYFLPKKEPEYHTSTEQPTKYHSNIKQNFQEPPFFLQKYFEFPANQPKKNITSYFSITPNSHTQEIHFQTVHDETYNPANQFNHPEPHHDHQHQFANENENVFTAEHLQIHQNEHVAQPQPFTANSAKMVQTKAPNADDIRPVFEYLNESEDNKPHLTAENVVPHSEDEEEESLTENYPIQIVSTHAPAMEEPKITTYKNSAMFSTTMMPPTMPPTTTTTESPPVTTTTVGTTMPVQAESRADVEEITKTPMTNPTACQRRCVKNTVARDYDPVCGSDGRTYSNKGKLRCAQSCGKNDLSIKSFGACHREQPAN